MTTIDIGQISGFPEWLPAERIVEQTMLDGIREGFERFGFVPIETPAVERTEVLTAKAGGEIGRQIYTISRLNSTDSQSDGTDLSLHFDLTVTLARYVAQRYHELEFPFRRYQMQKVWRGERPQAGRYREFYQCDIDIIGDGHLSLFADAEIPAVIYDIFSRLAFGDFVIRVSNRKILGGFLASCKVTEEQIPFALREVDRLERQGTMRVIKGLCKLGVRPSISERIVELAALSGDREDVLAVLEKMDIGDEFEQGVDELRSVTSHTRDFGLPKEALTIDLSIARGLDYYTGTVYETSLTKYPSIGSICSGGRYDDLAGLFVKRQFPGVGISIGLTRLFSRLLSANLITVKGSATAPVLVVTPDKERMSDYISIATELRNAGIKVELFTETEEVGIGRQLAYADNKGCTVAVLPFGELLDENKVRIRNLDTGDQAEVHLKEIAEETGKIL